MAAMRELRRGPRVPVDHLLVRLLGGNRITRGDVSFSGVGFEVAEPCFLKPGDAVEVTLYLPDQVLRLRAVVRRIEHSQPRSVGRSFVGAEMTGLDEMIGNPLYRFVEETALLYRPTL